MNETYWNLAGIPHISWHPDKSQLITISDKKLFLWERGNSQAQDFSQLTKDIDEGAIYSAGWSPMGGKYIAYSTEKSGLLVWNMDTQSLEKSLDHDASPRWQQLGWSPDGTKLAALYESETSKDEWETIKTIDIWDVDSWEIQGTKTINGPEPRLAWSPKNQRLAYGSPDEIRIWDLEEAAPIIHTFENRMNILRGLSWGKDGKYLATVGNLENISFWNAETGEESYYIPGYVPVGASAWSPDGRRIATGLEYGTVVVWNPLTGETVYLTSYRGSSVLGIAWGPNSDRFATIHWDGFTRVWNLEATDSPEQLDKVYTPDLNNISIVAWSQPKEGGQFIASGAEDGKIYTWQQVDQWGLVCILDDGNDAPVRSVSWSPAADQQWLASAEPGGKIYIWDTVNCGNEEENRITKPVDTLEGGHASDTRVTSVVWHATYPTKIASGSSDGQVLLWNQQDDGKWSPDTVRAKGDGAIRYLVWSSDGQQLAVGVATKIEVWDTTGTKGILDVLGSHGAAISTLSWSHDDQQLVSSSEDGTVRIWDVTGLE